MGNTARPATSGKYDLATKAEVEALRDETTKALAEMRRSFAKALSDEQTSTTTTFESTHKWIGSIDTARLLGNSQLGDAIAGLEDRMLAARWRRFVAWFRRPIW